VAKPWNSGGINNWLQMNTKTSHPDESWEFIRYWLTDGAVYMLKGGKVPAVPGIDEDTIVKGILGDNADALFDVEAYRAVALDQSARLVVDTITKGAAEVQTIFNQTSDQFLIGELSLDDWVTQTKAQADQAIASASA
jgi:multiple sugar transport system substrate-binding protein